jgi:hypothetical protein
MGAEPQQGLTSPTSWSSLRTVRGIQEVLKLLSSQLFFLQAYPCISPLLTVVRCSSRVFRGSQSVRQSGQQLLGAQNRVREARSIDRVRRVHVFVAEGSGRILQ